MIPIKQATADFLAQKRIAVSGVSREPGSHGANVVYRRLRERGYEVCGEPAGRSRRWRHLLQGHAFDS